LGVPSSLLFRALALRESKGGGDQFPPPKIIQKSKHIFRAKEGLKLTDKLPACPEAKLKGLPADLSASGGGELFLEIQLVLSTP